MLDGIVTETCVLTGGVADVVGDKGVVTVCCDVVVCCNVVVVCCSVVCC